MTFKRNAIFPWLIVLLALVPVLLFAYLGQFSRMMSDEYCTIAVGQELGAWDGMLYWYNSWTGSYARFFFMSAFAPLDALPPMMAPAIIIVLWLVGLSWLIFQGLAYLGIKNSRWVISIAVAALIVVAAINAFYASSSFYAYITSTAYILPLALLTIYLALSFWMAQRLGRNSSSLLGVLGGGVLCFLSAGTSEILVAFQFVFLTSCLLIIVVFLRSSVRRSYLLVFGVGWLTTLGSLAIQLNSPGVAKRAVFNEQIGRQPIRSIPALLSETLDRTFGYIGHAEAFAGFVMLLCLSLFVTLIKYMPQEPPEASKPRELSVPALWFGLIFQVIWIPILWGHTSDNPQFFGRFSIKYMMVIALNTAFIVSFLIMLWQRERINAELQKHKRSLFIVPNALPLFLVVLFVLTQSRNIIHFQALIYLFTSVFVFLGLLAWQLSSLLSSAMARRFGLLTFLSYGLAWVLIAAVVAASLFGSGYARLRTLTFASYLLVLPGLVWGGYIGYLIKNYALLFQRGQTWIKFLKIGSLVVVLIMTIGIVLGHATLIPDFQIYAKEWDARHREIIAMRDSGQTAVEVAPLTFDLAEYISAPTLGQYPTNHYAQDYYRLQSIIVSGPKAKAKLALPACIDFEHS